MPPALAKTICIIFIVFLFWTDRKKRSQSVSLWVPFLWMFFAAGRYPSDWLASSGANATATAADYMEGNPINAAVFFFLVAAGIFILSRREVEWRDFLGKNKLIWLYLLYCLASILWAQYSFVSFKRWVKEFGNLVMVLVILTEKRPYEALGTLIRRLGYLWLPLSVLFIKYVPDLGRAYRWDGLPMFVGIGTQKNGLGEMCLISAIYYGWYFIVYRKADFRFWGISNIADLILLAMMVWLFHKSESATSLSCAVVAVAIFTAGRFLHGKSDSLIGWCVAAALLYLGLNAVFDLNQVIYHMLGRRQDLTGRTEIWAIVEKMAGNPWVGVGYQSLWLGDRLKMLWEEIGANIIQSHNGYIEQYLQLGYIGLAFILAIMLAGLGKVGRLLRRDHAAGVLLFSLIVVSLLLNYTEASFYAVNSIWFLTVFAVIEVPEYELYSK